MNHMSSSFGELDLLRFVFEMNQQPVDNFRLQQLVFDHQVRNQMRYASLTPPPEPAVAPTSPTATAFKPQSTNASTPSTDHQVPAPKIVFNYAPAIPTPAATPEPIKQEPDHQEEKEEKRPLECVNDWFGASIYHNLPDVAMVEFDKMLRDSHTLKAEVIELLHRDAPINYDYNPNKSRVRTNYENPSVAEGRTRNNVASRRSRQRKKFFHQVLQYSVEFDEDENFLLEKQSVWLQEIIGNLERKIAVVESGNGGEDIERLRKQCGLT